MKQFLLPILLAFALLVPTVQVKAADVPDFYQVGGRHLIFTGRKNTTKGARVYGYDCSVDLKESFAEHIFEHFLKIRTTAIWWSVGVKIEIGA